MQSCSVVTYCTSTDVYHSVSSTPATKVCRYNWHSAGSLGWPFPVHFSTKIYGSNFIKQHPETVTVWNYRQNGDCSLRNENFVSFVIIFGTLSFPIADCFSWMEMIAYYVDRLFSLLVLLVLELIPFIYRYILALYCILPYSLSVISSEVVKRFAMLWCIGLYTNVCSSRKSG